MKKITSLTICFAMLILPLKTMAGEELVKEIGETIKIEEQLFNSSIRDSLKRINLNKVKVEELFYNKHVGTDYSPIKLEARIDQPLFINLDDVLAQAIENNLNLKIAQADSKIARWTFWSKVSDMLPDLNLNASAQNRDGTFYLNSNFQSGIDETISQAGLRLNYRVFNGGTTSFLAWAEKYYREATQANELSQYNKTLLNSVSNYVALIKNQVSIITKYKAFERAKVNFDLSKQFLNAGTGTKYDALQAEAQLARAQQELIQEEADFRLSQIDIAELLNQPLLTPYKIEDEVIRTFHYVDENISVDDMIKTAMENNPDIKAVLKVREAAVKEGLAKIGEFLPKVDIYMDLTGSGQEFDDLFKITTFGFNASYDIGAGLGLSPLSNVLESKAKVLKAKYEYDRELMRIEKELRTSFINFQKSKSLVDASHKEYLAANEALRLSKLRYKNGLEVFANLIDKEAELTQSELNLITAIADYNLSQVQLAYDMGKISSKDIIASQS